MIMIAGFICIIIGIAMGIRFMRNSRRPRIEVKVEEITTEHVRSDHKEMAPQQRHAHVKYNYDGQNYESKVIILKRTKENDWIEVSVNPDKPEFIDIYSPQKEKIAIMIVLAIGVFLAGGSWWLLDYFDAW